VDAEDRLAGSGIETATRGVSLATAPRPQHRSEPGFGVTMAVDGVTPSRSRQWRVRCQDVANRERFLTLFVEQGRVVLVGPPGESAVLTPTQADRLRTALQEAADEAER
jgi:hypothetical protein